MLTTMRQPKSINEAIECVKQAESVYVYTWLSDSVTGWMPTTKKAMLSVLNRYKGYKHLNPDKEQVECDFDGASVFIGL